MIGSETEEVTGSLGERRRRGWGLEKGPYWEEGRGWDRAGRGQPGGKGLMRVSVSGYQLRGEPDNKVGRRS